MSKLEEQIAQWLQAAEQHGLEEAESRLRRRAEALLSEAELKVEAGELVGMEK